MGLLAKNTHKTQKKIYGGLLSNKITIPKIKTKTWKKQENNP
jgi:hypothetical protein